MSKRTYTREQLVELMELGNKVPVSAAVVILHEYLWSLFGAKLILCRDMPLARIVDGFKIDDMGISDFPGDRIAIFKSKDRMWSARAVFSCSPPGTIKGNHEQMIYEKLRQEEIEYVPLDPEWVCAGNLGNPKFKKRVKCAVFSPTTVPWMALPKKASATCLVT